MKKTLKNILLLILCAFMLVSSFAFTACGKAKNTEYDHECEISIECKTILDNMDKFDKDKLEVLPEDGIILKKCTVGFNEGESVYDVLCRVTKANKIHMEATNTPVYNCAYIEGINNIYEFDCGEASGWMYRVNGVYPNYGCSSYKLKDGDCIEFRYTCAYGNDIDGGGISFGQQ